MLRQRKSYGRYAIPALCIWMAAFLLQTWSPTFIRIHFEWNQDYIARVLCINKDEPDMHCEGHCQLEEHLQTDREHKPGDNRAAMEFPPVVPAFIESSSTFRVFLHEANTHYLCSDSGSPRDFPESVFHPPRV